MKTARMFLVMFVLMMMAAAASAQTLTQTQEPVYTYRVVVINRTATAVNYGHRGGATKVDFKGTELLPRASGEAKVESKQGYIEIEVEFDELEKATKFGNEYLTYILWAITPEGRSVNLGEVLLNGNRSKLNVTTDLQAFALVVTAEPYFAVRRPSNVVVLENVIRRDTEGTTKAVDAKYDLYERGGYVPTGYNLEAVVLNPKLPLELYEARNAMRIARSVGAERYATPTYEKAAGLMKQAEAIASRKNFEKKALISVSREVVQTAEDAREIAIKRMEADRIDAESRASADREARALAQAADESQRRRDAEAQSRASADREANATARAADEEQRRRNAEAEAARSNRDAQAAADAAARAREAADIARIAAQQQLQAAEAESERNRAAAAAAEQQRLNAVHEREELRARLLEQFNTILVTRDTARGLIVNMSDVLFDTGKHTLRPLAREKLAKISGVMIAYPGLKLDIEGNTDNVGTDIYNQGLSERRAESVRSFLALQGVAASSMTAAGLGEAQPISTNNTAKGRQENRRVELIVSGEVIGTKIGTLRSQPN